jgi:CubicO group peptidase (beta-lactamase class C family)
MRDAISCTRRWAKLNRRRDGRIPLVRIYSMTKPITSVASCAGRRRQGRADDLVHRHPECGTWVYVAGLPGAFRPGTDSPMRMIDLLRHVGRLWFQTRSAVAAYRKCKVDPSDQHEGLEGFIAELGKMPLEFSPGTAWNYSVSTDVLGYLVGKISGEPFEDFLRRRIFEPLGMVDTAFHVPDEKAGRFAGCYLMSPQGKLAPVPGRSFREPAVTPSGGGGLVSTASDYLRFWKPSSGRRL